MKNAILASSTALALVWAAPAVSQSQLPALLEGMEAMAGQMDTLIEYSNKNVGSDYSVEYTDLRIKEDADNGTVISADWLRIAPSADVPGQITITLSPNASMTIADSGMEPVQIDILSDGVTAILDNMIPGAGGEAAETWNYVVNIPMMQFTASGANPMIRALSFSINGMETSSSFSPASQTVASAGSMGTVIFDFDINDPMGGQVAQSGNIVDMSYRFGFDMVDEDQMPDYFKGLRDAYLEFASGPQSVEVSMNGPDGVVEMSGQSASTDTSIAMTGGIFSMSALSGITNYQIDQLVIDGMPIPPFAIAMTGSEFGARVPLINSGNVEEASVKLAIENLVAPESLLAMIDPGQTIPRSPINIDIDLMANVISRINWDDPDSSFDSGNPADVAEVQDFAIRQFMIAAGGAEIMANGEGTVDNSMGFPFPTGAVSVSAKGVQNLVNALVQLGMMPQQQAGMMMGMMMGLARAEGPDHFVSDIEFSPNGVTANGNPLPF